MEARNLAAFGGTFKAPNTNVVDLFGQPCGYGAVLGDPAWRFDTYSDKGRGRSPDFRGGSGALPLLGVEASIEEAEKHYPTMPTDEICALPVGALTARDCVLYLWATLNMLPDALRVGASWGFKFATSRIWVKTRVAGFDPALTLDQNFPMGTGYIARGNPEPLLIFTKGSPRFNLNAVPRALIIAPRREHSRKPDGVHAEIERQTDGPYLELFARSTVPGWDCWGNQLDRFESSASAGHAPAPQLQPCLTDREHRAAGAAEVS